MDTCLGFIHFIVSINLSIYLYACVTVGVPRVVFAGAAQLHPPGVRHEAAQQVRNGEWPAGRGAEGTVCDFITCRDVTGPSDVEFTPWETIKTHLMASLYWTADMGMTESRFMS